MHRENRPLGALQTAEIDWEAGAVPRSRQFGDVYYDRDDGLAESMHCFVQGNELPDRWVAHTGESFCVLETGFGTGLNFLLTWQAWREQERRPRSLHFISIERHPLTREDLSTALSAWPALDTLAHELEGLYPPPLPGCHRLLFDSGSVQLDLYFGDAAEVLHELAQTGRTRVHAWYFDGFAPAKNADIWQASIFRYAAQLSAPAATASTFTAAGAVRRALETNGWDVAKVPGYGRKRESLRASLMQPQPRDSEIHVTPWDLPAVSADKPATALVVGGGLAGCWAANALARRGVAVTLLEQATIAGAASGNEQGILYTRLSHKRSAITDFALHSYLFATRCYADLLREGRLRAGTDGALCGNLQLIEDGAQLALLSTALDGLQDLARVVTRDEATGLLGIEPACGGTWFPSSGWLHPGAVCAALLTPALIESREHCGEIRLRQCDGQWEAFDTQGQAVARAPFAVLATGISQNGLEGLDWLPLRSIRGQTTHLPATIESAKLRAALCREGYIAPARAGTHCTGASFNLVSTAGDLSPADHADNLRKLADAMPSIQEELQNMESAALSGRVGFRCASPDYLPIAGQVPDKDAFLDQYRALRANARQVIPRRGAYLDGLYLSTAHGSRGLTSTPLCAESIAADICGEPPPLERALCRAIAPGRFLIRDLARNKA